MKYPDTSAVILAGGRSRRMGGEDKGLLPYQGRPMIAHVLAAVSTRVDAIFINANRNLERYRAFGRPVISDATADFAGPLAGLLAALRAARTPQVLVLPCDSPLIAPALIDRLAAAKRRSDADIVVAHDGRRLQPTFALLSVSLADDLAAFLARGGRKVDQWYEETTMLEVDCSDLADSFVNLNTPEELAALEQAAAQQLGGRA
jgi:molybdopterin-guanine dinucleotide biosynthesis protein A